MGSRKEKKAIGRKKQARERMIKQLQCDSLHVSIFTCIFLARFGMHDIAFGSFAVVAWVFLGVTVFSA